MKHTSNGSGACLCDRCCARARTVSFTVHTLGRLVSSSGHWYGVGGRIPRDGARTAA
jgi:hypothetical protein